MTGVRRICVFCGSSAGEDSQYLDAAGEMASLLAARDIELVYGGSRLGMMGRLADTMLDEGGRVVGIIPRALVNREVAHRDLTDLRVVASMHERKALMEEMSDAFVALPGGLGTMEEFCEILTWGQLGLHGKPCGLLDAGGYYQPLIRFLDHMVQEGFLGRAHRSMVLVERRPEPLLDRMEGYEPPPVPKWIEEDDT